MSFKPTFWQKVRSHLMSVLLETRSSAHNPLLEVVVRRGRLQLLTQNAIYSYADLYDNFSTVFEQLKLPKDGARVLVLGWGLGSIPFMLEKTFKKNYIYFGVEIDETVVQLFKDYVSADLQSPIHLAADDASIWVKQVFDEPFDLICIDLFVDATVPSVFGKSAFLEDIQTLLAKNGQVVYNRLAQNASERQETNQYYEQIFKSIFPQSKSIEISGNMMLVGRK